MRILVTNDDGIDSVGLQVLARDRLRAKGIIVAVDAERAVHLRGTASQPA